LLKNRVKSLLLKTSVTGANVPVRAHSYYASGGYGDYASYDINLQNSLTQPPRLLPICKPTRK